jgi:integration host factor subunit alpha
MRKAEIARGIHQQSGLSEHEAGKVLDWILALLKSTLQQGEPIVIANFGKFAVRSKRARKGRNPRTGEETMIPARRVVTFHASPLLKADVNAAGQERQEPSHQISRADGPPAERQIDPFTIS